MGKSSTTKEKSNSVTTEAPPPWVSAAQQSMLGTAQSTLAPYFEGNNWNADQQRAFEMIRGEAANPTFTRYEPTMALAAQLDPNAIQGMQNPYVSQVIQNTRRGMERQFGKDLNAVRAQGAASSAFAGSGSRTALQEASLRGDFGQRRDQMAAQLWDRNYQNALALVQGNVQNQQQTNLANAGYSNQAGLYNAQGQDVARQNALQQLLNIGNYQYGQPLQALQVLQQFLPREFGGTKTTQGSSEKTTPGQSPLQSILGLGLSLAPKLFGLPL